MRRSALLLPLVALTGLTACMTHYAAPVAIPVFFQNASVMLGADARDAVARAAKVAKANPELKVELVGYQLPNNAAPESVQLSVARAAAVREELVHDGIDAARVRDHAGGALPAAPDTPIASRRVDISFVK